MAALIGKVGIVMKGVWSSSIAYEALDAVSSADGLYIAKIAVPAGTALSNATYWQEACVITQKQNKTLSTPLSINGTTQTTVEGALGKLSNLIIFKPFSIATTDKTATISDVDTTKYNLISLVQTNTNQSVATIRGYYVSSGTFVIQLEDYPQVGTFNGLALFMYK